MVPAPDPSALTGLTFFGATPEEAERAAKAYLGLAEPIN
jgi:predicted RNase H-like HicB family nuclease